jgi:hypothetical protein
MKGDPEDLITMERAGSDAGLNPMFGEWQHKFTFAPVPYGDGGAKRAAFREAIQAQLKDNRWIYSHEICLEITLFLDVQTVLETSETADLDNYAKAILDGLKGPPGIMLDDTQVQALSISWLDGYRDPSFVVCAKGSSDDFLLKPVEFYEMPDGLWYPQSRLVWSDGEQEALTDKDHFLGLSIFELMSSVKKRARAEMRNAGADRLRAYQRGRYVSGLARGFHRSRISDGGFPLHQRKQWQAAREAWKCGHGTDALRIEEGIGELRQAYEPVIDVLAGRVPDEPRCRTQ